MLINKTTQDVIRVLLNEKDKKMTLRELAAKANISLGMAVKIAMALESSGYVEKKQGIRVKNWQNLLKAWSYSVSINEYKRIEFLAPERPQYLIKKISNLFANETYAFTLFSATEIVAPYVAPDKVHLCVLTGNEKKLNDILVKNGIMAAEKGNIVCYLVDESHFYGSNEIRSIKVISFSQLYADLISYGGRGEEAAAFVMKLIEEQNLR